MNAPWSTIPDLVDDAALRFGDREAIVDGDLRWTFAEYRDQIHAASRALMAHGIGAGDRIAVWAPNAEHVSVVGEFNGWNPTRHPMRLVESTGIWAASRLSTTLRRPDTSASTRA